MTVTRRGKIARLPKAIRDELNRRLENGELGGEVLPWLNRLPEVQRIMTRDFGGRPIQPQNLCEWRQGGYLEWLQDQNAAELVRQYFVEAKEIKNAVDETPSDILGTWLIARYALAARELEKNGQLDMKQLRELCSDVTTLRRSDHSAARLKLRQDQLERERETTEKQHDHGNSESA